MHKKARVRPPNGPGHSAWLLCRQRSNRFTHHAHTRSENGRWKTHKGEAISLQTFRARDVACEYVLGGRTLEQQGIPSVENALYRANAIRFNRTTGRCAVERERCHCERGDVRDASMPRRIGKQSLGVCFGALSRGGTVYFAQGGEDAVEFLTRYHR